MCLGYATFSRLARRLGAAVLVVCAVAAEGNEVYFDQFDRDDAALNQDFWSAPVPGAESLATGALLLKAPADAMAVRTRSLGDAPLFNQYTVNARLRITPGQSSAAAARSNFQLILRSDGEQGYGLSLDPVNRQLRLQRVGGEGDLVPPVALEFHDGDQLHVRATVEGYGPVTITAEVSRTADFATPLARIKHTEKKWVRLGDTVQFRASGDLAASIDYVSVGTPGYEHPAADWNRAGYTDAPPGGPMQPIGRLVSADASTGEGVVLKAEGGTLRILPRLDGVVKVEFDPAGQPPAEHRSWSVTRTDWPAAPATIVEGNPLKVVGQGWSIDVERDPLRLVFRDGKGQVRLAEAPGVPTQSKGTTRRVAFELAEGESLYAMGQHALQPDEINLDLRGHSFQVENRHGPTGTIVMPFWLSTRNYGVYIDNAGLASIDAGESNPKVLEYNSRAGNLAYYVFLGDSMAQVLDSYTAVVGRPALAPRWTLGTMQSRFGYRSFSEVQEIIDGFRSRAIPLDTVILDLDWFGRGTMGNLDFDKTDKWPNPVESMAAIHQQGIKIIPITEPQVTGLSYNAPEAMAKGLFARAKDDRMPYATDVWWIANNAPVYLLDFTRAETRAWWGEKHRKLMVDYHFDGFWQDLNEPEGGRGGMRFAGGTLAEVQNVAALQMNRALAEGMEKNIPGARPFIMSRSGFVGMQKYGAGTWSGDVGSNWPTFSRQPMIGLHMSLSGVPYWNSDVGGYGGETTPELYLRWCQFAFFNPIYRPHAAHMAREPWAFGPKVEEAVRKLLLLRSRLVPYYYTTARAAYDTGTPMMRPLVLDWPDDPAVRDLADQFLYGPALMAAPMLEDGATSRTVHLPAGTWYDWFAGTRLDGGKEIVQSVPLDQFAMFVRAPAIIPMGPEVMRTDERPLDEVTLRAYLPADAAKAEGELYEDDGLTLAYQQNACARTRFTLERAAGKLTLTIGAAQGTFEGMVKSRAWILELHDADKPAKVTAAGADAPFEYDAKARVLTVKLGSQPVEKHVVVEIGG